MGGAAGTGRHSLQGGRSRLRRRAERYRRPSGFLAPALAAALAASSLSVSSPAGAAIAPPNTLTITGYIVPTSVLPGATAIPMAQAKAAELGDGAADSSGVVAASLGSIDLADAPSGSSATGNPLGEVTLGQLGLDSLAAGSSALLQIPLTELPIEGGWERILIGTRWEFVPLQTVTLGDVYSLGAVQSTPLKFTDVAESPLKFTDVAAVALGGLPVLDIDLDGNPATDSRTEWCAAIASVGENCTELGLDPGSGATLGSLSAAGVDLEATPLKFTPLKFTYIEASPLKFTPLKFTDLEASPLKFTPLKFTDLEASPLKFTPLKFTPLKFTPLKFTPLKFTSLKFTDLMSSPLKFTTLASTANPNNIVDCSAIDCSLITIGDAAEVGLTRPTFTAADLGDTGLRWEDLLPYLAAETVAELEATFGSSSYTIEDLLAQFALAGLGDMTLADIDPEAWETVFAGVTIGEFLATADETYLAELTLADFMLLFLPRTAYEWDEVNLADVDLQADSTVGAVNAALRFTSAGDYPTSEVRVSANLPAGAVFAPDSVTVSPAGPTITSVSSPGETVVVDLTGVLRNVEYTVNFGILPGLVLGMSDSQVTATIGLGGDSEVASMLVREAFEPANNSPGGPVQIQSDTLYVSHIGSPDDVDYFALTVTEPHTDVSIRLGNLTADFDLVVYGPKLGSIVANDAGEVTSAPDADFSPNAGERSAVPMDDLPTSLDGLQVYGVSYHRRTLAEQVDFRAIESGTYLVQVTGYLGASSPGPYSLQAASATTAERACPARQLPNASGAPGTTATVGSSTNALVLLNRSRLTALYGNAATADVVAAAESMVAAVNSDQSDGLEAAVLDVDAFESVRAAYSAWDASPCSPIATNHVVGELTEQIRAIRASGNIDHLLIVGGDDVIPFGRVVDGTTIANEQSYTSTFSGPENNALRAAFAGSWLLTDDPYADDAPVKVANTDRVVYVPELSLGRLVETPDEIAGALNQYAVSGGLLDPQSGFVAGYDFLDDGAAAVADELDGGLSPAVVARLINEGWTRQDLGDALASGPDVALVAAHFDHLNALPAEGNRTGAQDDLFDVTDAGAIDFTGSVIFSMGCHSGLSVSDVLIAPTGVLSTDWAQTFMAGGAAAYVGNTGYGYGDDAAVALSEALMAGFASGLGEYATVGEALLYAKQNYAADLSVYGAFDEKALMEATFYGIPFYRLPNSRVAEPVPNPTTIPAATGGQATTATFDPQLTPALVGTDQYWYTPDVEGKEQIQVTSGYPILPRFEWEVTQQNPNGSTLDLVATGVVLESLSSVDHHDVDPATARAIYDLAEHEPNTDADSVRFALKPVVTSYLSPEGPRQDVTMAVGAFEATEPDGTGTMRLFEGFQATVYYAVDPNGDRDDPVIRRVETSSTSGRFNVAVTVEDRSTVSRVLALVTPTPQPGQTVNWAPVELVRSGGRWTGTTPVSSAQLQWIVMAVDANGNTAWSTSKGIAFDGSTEVPSAPVLGDLAGPMVSVAPGRAAHFTVEVTDYDGSSDAWSLTWDFGDGTTCRAGATGCGFVAPTDADPIGVASAQHAYADPGLYPVTVTVSDSTGGTDTVVFRSVHVSLLGAVKAKGLFSASGTAPGGFTVGQVTIAMEARLGGNGIFPPGQLKLRDRGTFTFVADELDQLFIHRSGATLAGTGMLNDVAGHRFEVVMDKPRNSLAIVIRDGAGAVVVDLRGVLGKGKMKVTPG